MGFEPMIAVLQTAAFPLGYVAVYKQSGRWDSNPRLSPWQGDALPLSHARTLKSLRVPQPRLELGTL